MAAAPIAIGTRGTVGSLLNKEIEYFTKFELEAKGSGGDVGGRSRKSHVQVEMDCRNGHPRPGFWFSITSWKRKKRQAGNNNGGFLPSMCSAIEVAEHMNRYRILKNDVHKYFHI
ncbi:Kinase superfamily protein [Hibiscus syriacus]|uniref:Kinase superfamily protein n=1 Tax=Hibiscus syriacus TaxID=106335 RepID=A0A6A2ZCH1_HIBSY|nr:Kinase superfamily protein [Hibiscus syriacus]